MVLLKLLAIVNTQLSQAKKKPDNNTAIFYELAWEILMRDFYQFSLIVKKPIWEIAITT